MSEPPRTLPAVDERLVMPESGYEIIDGQVVRVTPADHPHGRRHAKLAAILEVAAGPGFEVAVDMLTRTSETSDMAPDASVYPAEPDPVTGGRQLEHLAFEVVSTESLTSAAKKAARLQGRGVRRVFAIDVERQRALEYDAATEGWSLLPHDVRIEDPCFEVPLALHDLVSAARADDLAAQILLERRNRVLTRALAKERSAGRKEGRNEGRKEGRKEGRLAGHKSALLTLLELRGLALTDAQRARVAAATATELERYTSRVLDAPTVEALLDE